MSDDEYIDAGMRRPPSTAPRNGRTPEEVRLRAELQRANERNAALDQRCSELQAANERMYASDYQASGGPRFDPLRPFGAKPGFTTGFIARMTGGAQ